MQSSIPGWSRRGLLGIGAAMAAGRLLRAQPTEGVTHALIVGINTYGTKPLKGCVNDAGLVERRVRPLAASTTVLRDEQATRAGFDAAWEGVTARLRPGDRLLFTFAGHGNRVPRPDGTTGMWDNFLVFQGYNIATAPRDILLDSEIERRFAVLGRRGVSVVFVADCCHSGALTRGADTAAQLTTRTQAGLYALPLLSQAVAAGPPPPPPARPEELQHVHFYGACQPLEVVPEIRLEGEVHGALSVALAAGLAGAADADRDGAVTAREMADYMIRTVRGTADARQSPEAKLGMRAPSVLFRVRALVPEPPSAGEPVRLRIEGTMPAGLPTLRDVQIVQDGAFDLLWRPGAGQTVSTLGDVLAENGVTAERLPASVARLRALARVQALLARSPMEIRLERVGSAGGDAAGQVQTPGTVLRLALESIREPYTIIFNIAGDGTVQNLYPHPKRAGERAVTPLGGRKTIEGITVEPPFGTDRFVAIAAEHPLDGLADSLRALDGLLDPLAAMDAVERAVAGGRFQVGLGAMFSRMA